VPPSHQPKDTQNDPETHHFFGIPAHDFGGILEAEAHGFKEEDLAPPDAPASSPRCLSRPDG